MIKAYIYARVSTAEQAQDGYSLGEQEDRLKAFAKSKGYEVIKVFTDGGLSGASMNRPGLQEMISKITSTDVVLVYKLDRLSRSQKDTLYLIEEVFIKNKVDFISLNESFDTSTAFGRAMIGILSVFAQLERENLKERYAMGRVGRARNGKWFGGGKWRPFGYDYKDGELIVNEYESQAVKRAYDLSLQGYGTGKIFKFLNEEYPNAIAGSSTIVRMLNNPIYIGKINWQGELYDGIHQPIIDADTYQSVQRIRARNSEKYSKPRGINYVLSGHLVCSNCGSPLNGRRGGKRKDGTYLEYYTCSGQGNKPWKKHNPNCDFESWKKGDLEQLVFKQIENITIQDIELKKKDDNNSKDIEVLTKEIKSIDKKVEKLIDLYVLEDINMGNLQKRIDTLHSKKRKLEKRISKLKDEALSKLDKLEAIKSIEQFSERNMEDITKEQQRLIVDNLIDKVKVYQNKIDIHWSF